MSDDVLIVRPVPMWRFITRLPLMWWKLRCSIIGKTSWPGWMAFRIALIHLEIKVRNIIRTP